MIKMRRNSTLPTIRQSTSAVAISKSKGGEPFRKIQDKINSHDEEIVKNDKIISTLANEFRLLKEQLEFQQQYSEKYKNTMNKYEEEKSKYLKVIRDQKQIIAKLEHLNKEKEKALDVAQKERTQFKERCEEQVNLVQQLSKECKKKQAQLQKARKEIKQKQQQLKQKQAEIKEAFVSDRHIRESKIKKVEKDLELLHTYLENSKEQIAQKDSEIQRLNMELFQAQEKMKGGDKNELKARTLLEEMKLAHREIEQLKKRVKELQEQNKLLQISVKAVENRSNSNANDKGKQFQQQKKDLLQRVEKLIKESELYRRQWQQQRRQRQKQQRQIQQYREKLYRLQTFSEKLMKTKGQITSQLSKLKGNIMCDYCTKPMKNPVTNIPCGHSYCQDCKAGYIKQCKKCSGVKRQAVYRNQLLDQIIQASALVQKIVNLMVW